MRLYLTALFFLLLALACAWAVADCITTQSPLGAALFFVEWLACVLILVMIRRADLREFGTVAP